MLTRAERKFDLAQGQTPPTVAPGSYSNGAPSGPRNARVLDGRAPFGSQTSRYQNSLYSDGLGDWPAPEPAQYSVVDYDAPVVARGGASMHSRSRRFKYPVAEGPDPASYHVDRPLLKHKREVARHEPRAAPSAARMPTAAPIPARWETKGYTEDPATGVLVKASPEPPSGSGIGPASYGKIQLDQRPPETAVDFGKRSGRRSANRAQRDGPAPGSYDNPITAFSISKPTRAPRQTAPRWKSESDRAPAPNTYDVVGATSTFKTAKVPKQMQFFGTTAVRAGIDDVIKEKKALPAPGQYDDPRRALAAAGPVHTGEERQILQDRRPFGQSSTRFPRSRNVGPGPAGYSSESWFGGAPSVRDNVEVSIKKASTIAPFGGTGPRSGFNERAVKRLGPPPGKYNVSKRDAIGTGTKISGPFKSTAPMRPKIKPSGPPPSAYDIRLAAGDIHTVPPPRNQRALYVGSSQRFKVHGTTQVGRLPDTSVPAPNSYNAGKSQLASTGGRMLDHNKNRFDDAGTATPGPNAYTMQGAYSRSLVKPTFNATFDKHDDTV
mmetsp:Transcript_17404/g.51504  ORF Transcript_17404/g.51504 Transcript_17404/m.51504 type:complete len:550 (+) Transcript_17404:470-2119(+)